MVYIIVLNYKGAPDTVDCLKSLADITYVNYRIVVVDNASPDDSVDVIVDHLNSEKVDYVFYDSVDLALNSAPVFDTSVVLIRACYNGGYGYGNNQGVRYALSRGAEYIVLLNNDTVVESGFLEPLVQLCISDSKVAISSGKVYFFNQPNIIWSIGGTFRACSGSIRHFYFGEVDSGQMPRENIEFISGCVWCVPGRIFREAGLIDESYFMYVEDLEFCQRVLGLGFKLAVSEESRIWHKVGSSSGGGVSSFSVFYSARNLCSYIIEHSTGLCRISGILNVAGVGALRLIYHRQVGLLLSHIKGVLCAVRVRRNRNLKARRALPSPKSMFVPKSEPGDSLRSIVKARTRDP